MSDENMTWSYLLGDIELLKVIEAMSQDSGITLSSLKVDGRMTSNNLLMQLQADLVGIDIGLLTRLWILLITSDAWLLWCMTSGHDQSHAVSPCKELICSPTKYRISWLNHAAL